MACYFLERPLKKKFKLIHSVFHCLPEELLKSIFDFYGPLNDHGFDELLELRTLSKYFYNIVIQSIGAKFGWSNLPLMNTPLISKVVKCWKKLHRLGFFYPA
jgi:hypothetical protein